MCHKIENKLLSTLSFLKHRYNKYNTNKYNRPVGNYWPLSNQESNTAPPIIAYAITINLLVQCISKRTSLPLMFDIFGHDLEDVILVPVTSELATDAHKLLLLSLLMMEYPYRELGATRVLVHGKKRYEDLGRESNCNQGQDCRSQRKNRICKTRQDVHR